MLGSCPRGSGFQNPCRFCRISYPCLIQHLQSRRIGNLIWTSASGSCDSKQAAFARCCFGLKIIGYTIEMNENWPTIILKFDKCSFLGRLDYILGHFHSKKKSKLTCQPPMKTHFLQTCATKHTPISYNDSWLVVKMLVPEFSHITHFQWGPLHKYLVGLPYLHFSKI